MAHKMLKCLAFMGRVSVDSQERLIHQLRRFGTPEEVTAAVREAYAMPEEELRAALNRMSEASEAAEQRTANGTGVGVLIPGAAGERGFDDADRIAQSIMLAALDPEQGKGLN